MFFYIRVQDVYKRQEYNEMLLSKISDTNNSILRERYLTISVHKKNIDEARTYFARVGTDITTHLAKLSSIGEELDAGERLKICLLYTSAIIILRWPIRCGVYLVSTASVRAVSYTHLDVYKRQGLLRSVEFRRTH